MIRSVRNEANSFYRKRRHVWNHVTPRFKVMFWKIEFGFQLWTHQSLHPASTQTYPWDDDLDVICIGGGVQKL